MIEIWKDVIGFEGLYQVSNTGNVKSMPKHIKNGVSSFVSEVNILKNSLTGGGYYRVNLRSNSTTKSMLVHRLIAMAFIPNPQGKLYINHKNGIKTDNSIDNLEWCTHRENMVHAFETGLIKVDRDVRLKNIGKAIDSNNKKLLNTQTGIYHFGIHKVAKEINIQVSSFQRMLQGKKTNITPYVLL